MFEIFNTLNEPGNDRFRTNPYAAHARMFNSAIHRFNNILSKGRLARTWAFFTGRRVGLINLAEYSLKLNSSSYAGIKSVPIHNIHGTEGKSGDFDSQFHPIHERSRDRWVSVAMARCEGIGLPAVELIQIGESYFVRDGHHRISVARSMGQEQIDAYVTVWQVAGPLSWQGAENHPASRFISFGYVFR